MSIGSEASDLVMNIDELPEGSGVKMFYVLVEFLQELNGVMYPLKSGSYNALKLMSVV